MQSQIDPELPEETSGPNIGKILVGRLRQALGFARDESTAHGTAIEGLQENDETLSQAINDLGTSTANSLTALDNSIPGKVRSAVLTGISFATNAAISSTDTVLGALGKLQKQFTDHFDDKGHLNATQKANPLIKAPAGADDNGGIYDAAGKKISTKTIGVAIRELLSPTEAYDHPMPARSRITQYGTELFNPIGVTPRMVLNCTVEDHIGYPHLIASINSDSTPQVPCRRIVPTDTAAGTVKVRYDNLNIMMPSDGLLQLPIYWPNIAITTTMYINVILFQRGTGTNKTLLNATGYYDADVTTRRYSFTRFGLESGFNVLELFNPNNTNHLTPGRIVGMNFNETTGSSGAWNDANPIIGIEIQMPGLPTTDIDGNAVNAMPLPLGSLYSQTKMKPVIMMIPDTSNANIYEKLVPIFKAKGLPLTLRWGGTNGSRRQLLNYFLANQDIDHYDGSWSRLATVGEDTSVATFLPEASLGRTMVGRYGHHKGAIFYSGAGNAIPSKAVAQRVFKQTGHKFSKAGTRQTMVTPLTPFGIANPFGMPAIGYRGYNSAIQDINAVKTYGGILIWFVHECVDFANRLPGDAAHVLYTDRPNNSGGGIYTEDAQALADYLAAGVANGEYDVLSVSQLAEVLGV